MKRLVKQTIFALWLAAVAAPDAFAQQRPYIGFVYPAGGRQGTTFKIRVGGQGMDEVKAIIVSGPGVNVRVGECLGKLNQQEHKLLTAQLQALRKAKPADDDGMCDIVTSEPAMMVQTEDAARTGAAKECDGDTAGLEARLERRTREYVGRPACAAISILTFAEVSVSQDAPVGERELRLVTSRGVSNPLYFHVGRLAEYSRKPEPTSELHVLGKEGDSVRRRPPSEVEQRIVLPCTVNGQIGPGEINRYRFEARKGQRLVISTLGRQLVPYIADAVPGWFQPVLALYDDKGREVAYSDGYRFSPDPVILYQVQRDGLHVFEVRDSIYRGREDFVYRITVGEVPFVTAIFPLGRRTGGRCEVSMDGWNLDGAELMLPPAAAEPGVSRVAAKRGDLLSNPVPFAIDDLPECIENDRGNDIARSQTVTLPIVVNGRIDRPGDRDVFRFSGRSNDTVVAEVNARRLDSPLDSVLTLTDASGAVLAASDDREDPGSGLNTHHADSYLTARLPADGDYCVNIADTTGHGGGEYAYRLRISGPQPDFALRIVPSSAALRVKGGASLDVSVIRKDGFDAPVKLVLRSPTNAFSMSPVTLAATQSQAKVWVKTSLTAAEECVSLVFDGRAKAGDREIIREAVPAEDRMQAFLWRHLVPAKDLQAMVFDPSIPPVSKRPLPVRDQPPVRTEAVAASTNKVSVADAKAAKQIEQRLKSINRLYREGLLEDDFYWKCIDECEAAR